MASFESINYSLRPGKGVERKMICDLARRLSVFDKIEEYSYIGFGSIFFADFTLFHKALGMRNMHSIEREVRVIKDPVIQSRFEFNKPFSCVKVHYGSAADMLPAMDWGRRAIIWLDYDGKLDNESLSDLRIVLRSVRPGSLVLISTNVQPDFPPADSGISERVFRYQETLSRLDLDYLPEWVHTENLTIVRLISAYHYALTGTVNETIGARNGSSENPIVPRQLINIRYKDNAEMLTLGWLITDKSQEDSVEKARFQDLNFVNVSAEPFRIQIPPLTIREINWIDSALHTAVNPDGTIKLDLVSAAPLLPPRLVSQYANIYRYFPTFAEAIL